MRFGGELRALSQAHARYSGECELRKIQWQTVRSNGIARAFPWDRSRAPMGLHVHSHGNAHNHLQIACVFTCLRPFSEVFVCVFL